MESLSFIISDTFPSVFSTSSSTAALARESTSMPFSFSQSLSCDTLFGFSSPDISYALLDAASLYKRSHATAWLISSRSTMIPRSLILWSMQYSSCSLSVIGNFASLFLICFSTSTSRMQYVLNSSHFSGASDGRFLVLPPFALVGLHGIQK